MGGAQGSKVLVVGTVGTSGGGSAISGAYSGGRRVPTVSALETALVRGHVRVRLKEDS